MTAENISRHLKKILKEEEINAEDESLDLIAKAAHGSMRDALSILDQAIAYSGSEISSKKIISMLGTVDDTFLSSILNALAEADGVKVIQLSKEMDEKSISFDLALEELARLIHKISMHQIIPDNLNNSGLNEEIQKLATAFTPETLQLNYQIAINGRRDLHLAPDPITGFNMTLLRMLAFYPSIQPIKEFNSKKKIETEVNIIENVQNIEGSENSKNKITLFDGDWKKLVNNLKVGIVKSLAQECSLLNYEDYIFNLILNEKFQHLGQNRYIDKLENEISNYLNKKIKVNISLGSDPETPSMEKKIGISELMKTTESAIMEDSFVKELIDDFGAEIITSSIKPTKNKEN